MRDLKDIAAHTQRFRDAVRAVHCAIDNDHESSTLRRFHPQSEFIKLNTAAKSTACSRLRRLPIFSLSTAARLLDIPGREQIVKESYPQMRKFNYWNISIV
jgi:hypothetical protein